MFGPASVCDVVVRARGGVTFVNKNTMPHGTRTRTRTDGKRSRGATEEVSRGGQQSGRSLLVSIEWVDCDWAREIVASPQRLLESPQRLCRKSLEACRKSPESPQRFSRKSLEAPRESLEIPGRSPEACKVPSGYWK